jgi:hypothetical protein
MIEDDVVEIHDITATNIPGASSWHSNKEAEGDGICSIGRTVPSVGE